MQFAGKIALALRGKVAGFARARSRNGVFQSASGHGEQASWQFSDFVIVKRHSASKRQVDPKVQIELRIPMTKFDVGPEHYHVRTPASPQAAQISASLVHSTRLRWHAKHWSICESQPRERLHAPTG